MKFPALRTAAWTILLCVASAAAQQNVPDAPAPKTPPPGQFPDNAPPANKNTRETPPDDSSAAPKTPPGDNPSPPSQEQPSPSQPQSGAEQKPAQQPAQPAGQDQGEVVLDARSLGKISVRVNFVTVPVTVKDNQGNLVAGLTYQDFSVLENGVAQKLSFFTSDPLPLSAAVIVDTDLPADTMKKINESLPALVGAFSQYDEVGLYTYSHSVKQVSTFAGAANIPTTTLAEMKREGRGAAAPIGGPLASGPSINGHPAVPGTMNPAQTAPPPELHVLNDAVLKAAQDLARRGRDRRKIIFVVSDGRELGSQAHYDEVKRVLLTYNISVYALGVDMASVPIYDRLNRIRIPGLGYGDLLPKYVSDTAGQGYAEFDRASIEQAYNRLLDMARNQYTLGYYTKASPSSSFRTIEVKVHRPNLVVFARDGYYPLPPERH